MIKFKNVIKLNVSIFFILNPITNYKTVLERIEIHIIFSNSFINSEIAQICQKLTSGLYMICKLFFVIILKKKKTEFLIFSLNTIRDRFSID